MSLPGVFVLFGATGDLARRMLLPSLYFLDLDGLLPTDLRILGAARSRLSREDFTAEAETAVAARTEGGKLNDAAWKRFSERLSYVGGDAQDEATYADLKSAIGGASALFYLSTSPDLYGPVVDGLARHNLTEAPNRVILEKPIGKDLDSCNAINEQIGRHFSESRIFRIDHYLGKETVQNLIALRFANALFEPLWNKTAIDHVQITVAETVGVEGRFSYYDEYGATRDMVQNHLLQLLALIAMEPPANLRPESLRNEKVKVLRSLRSFKDETLLRDSVRGQYVRGVVDGEIAPGYLDEAPKDVGKGSATETFVALTTHIDNWRWAGVPFYLRTGKRMPVRSSQIVVQFRDVPHSIFAEAPLQANRLTIRLQPEEEISLLIMNKTPTLRHGGYDLQPLSLNLSLLDAFKGEARRRIAYERLLLEAIDDRSALFVRRDESEAAWLFIDRIIEGWRRLDMKPAPYAAGSWGPADATRLTQQNGHSWFE